MVGRNFSANGYLQNLPPEFYVLVVATVMYSCDELKMYYKGYILLSLNVV